MAKCAQCGTSWMIKGKEAHGLTFCSAKCAVHAPVLSNAQDVPDDQVASEAHALRSGPCPHFNQRRGPVDAHQAHKVASFLIMTSWSSTPRLSCRPCGRKAQATAFASSFFLGWWGINWGIVTTPVSRNIAGMLRGDSSGPSIEMQRLVRYHIAASGLQAQG